MDNAILFLCLLIGTAAVVLALVLARRQKKPGGTLLEFRETRTILGFTVLCLFMGYGICLYKFSDRSVGGEGTASYWLCGVSGAVLLLLAAYTLLLAFVKVTRVSDEGLEIVNEYGGVRRFRWDQVVRVENTGMRRGAAFVFSDGSRHSFNGANRSYQKLMALAKDKLSSRRRDDLVKQVENNLLGL